MPDDPHASTDPITDSQGPGTASSEREAATPGPLSFLHWLGELLLLVAVAALIAGGVRTFVVRPFQIPSGSMAPTLEIGDRVLVAPTAYRLRDPKAGDIAVFRQPELDDRDYIKRIVAVGGQVVDIADGRVSVDGRLLDEPYTGGLPTEPGDVQLPCEVPPGHVFLMGDNRVNSRDSRWSGPRAAADLVGPALVLYWPPARMGSL